MKYPIPEKALHQHIAVLGKTGRGKSSAMRGGFVEPLLEENEPVCIVDPKGDWWGLKSSADGKRAGYPVVIFGGDHADVPINEHSGSHIAELVATGNRPCIIDLGGWMVGERTRFFIAFASTLFKLTRGQRWLVIDECHNFAPQGKILDIDAGKMLHWANRLASEGRGKGINLIAASQRPQKVHKDFLTSMETLIAMGVVHKLDRDAVKDWIDGCADPATGKEVIATLAGLPRGEGWVWSPEIDFGPKRIVFPFFKTYDSFKPQAADAGKLKGWAEVDLDDVKAKLVAVVEEYKANDPAELKKQIRALERQVAAKPAPASKSSGPKVDASGERRHVATLKRLQGAIEALMKFVVNVNATGFDTTGVDPEEIKKAIESAVVQAMKLADAQMADRMKVLQRLQSEGGRLIASVQKLLADQDVQVSVDVKHNAPFTVAPARSSFPVKTPVSTGVKRQTNGSGGDSSLSKAERRALTALAQYAHGRTKAQVAVLSGYAVNGGGFNNALSSLRTKGLIEGAGDRLEITQDGLGALGAFDPLPQGDALLQHWLGQLSKAERAALIALANAYPKALSKEDVAASAGYEPNGGGFNNALSRLRTLELISGRGELRASEDLF